MPMYLSTCVYFKGYAAQITITHSFYETRSYLCLPSWHLSWLRCTYSKSCPHRVSTKLLTDGDRVDGGGSQYDGHTSGARSHPYSHGDSDSPANTQPNAAPNLHTNHDSWS